MHNFLELCMSCEKNLGTFWFFCFGNLDDDDDDDETMMMMTVVMIGDDDDDDDGWWWWLMMGFFTFYKHLADSVLILADSTGI